MSRARIRWISGPVLRAATEGPFRMRESIRVGPDGLLGEVIRVQEDEIVARVYEDTTGLRPGVVVEGSVALLSVLLGPHLLGGIFDGLLRPLARPGAQGAAACRAGRGGADRLPSDVHADRHAREATRSGGGVRSPAGGRCTCRSRRIHARNRRQCGRALSAS